MGGGIREGRKTKRGRWKVQTERTVTVMTNVVVVTVITTTIVVSVRQH